jgi:hypothetical protein
VAVEHSAICNFVRVAGGLHGSRAAREAAPPAPVDFRRDADEGAGAAGAGGPVGRRLLDDGSAIPEHTLTTLGDAVTLNSGATIQRHSPEDGTSKSDRTEIGDGATVGVPAFVHYGVTMGEGSCWTRTRS